VDGPFAAFEERFGDDARRTLAYAWEEAQGLHHHYIGTEHLLLGLLRDTPGVSARLLRRLGVDLDETRAAVEYVVGRGAAPASGAVKLAPRARRTLELAVELAAGEAREAGTQAPGQARPEHLLLALLHGQGDDAPGRGIAAGILQGFGVSAEKVREALPPALAEAEAESGREVFLRLAKSGAWEEATQAIAKWRERRRQGRRYSLVMPDDLFAAVERLAERQQTTVVELLRRFTRLGLLAAELQERPDAALIIREGGTERQLLLL
jgi:ATP-dependent Clp protease ATP-binding subunit ClpA